MISLEMVMPFLMGLGLFFLLLFGFFALFKAFYIKVPQGTALIINDLSSQPVSSVYFKLSPGPNSSGFGP